MESSTTSEVPSHRACDHCRSQKVRCIPEGSDSENCQRCARLGRPCVSARTSKRKQRKRTDTRVSELEKEMRLMRTLLGKNQIAAKAQLQTDNGEVAAKAQREASIASLPRATSPLYNSWTVEEVQQDMERSDSNASQNLSTQTNDQQQGPICKTIYPNLSESDVVERGVISTSTARLLFETYVRDLFPHYPIVVIPSDCTADELRQEKPMLFLAIITAASGKVNPELSDVLDREVLQAYATRTMINSEKSLEVVQALLISAVWYHPPSRSGQLMYYEYIHMAATIALDIGIGTRPAPSRTSRRRSQDQTPVNPITDPTSKDLRMTLKSKTSSLSSASIESRRTYLACYLVCAGVSMSLRRPNMIRPNSWIRECIECIETSPNSAPSDPSLIAWIRLVLIGDEISTSYSLDDLGEVVSLSDFRVQLMMKDYQKRLKAWERDTPDEILSDSLLIIYYTIRIVLQEIALHVDHAPEDFKAPYHMGKIQVSDKPDVPTAALMAAIAELVSSSHSLLDIFLSMDVESLRGMPVLSHVRVSYAAFVLCKLNLSASHLDSRIGEILDRDSLKVMQYLDQSITKVSEVIGPMMCKVPTIFLALLFKLRFWCQNPKVLLDDGEDSEEIILEKLQTQARAMMGFKEPQVVKPGELPLFDSGAPQLQNLALENNNLPLAIIENGQDGVPNLPCPAAFSTAADFQGTSTSVQEPASYLPMSDQMELDSNFFAMLNDSTLNTLEGSQFDEDWAGQVPDIFNWPSTGQDNSLN